MAERQNPKTFVNNLVVDTKSAVNDNIALAKAEVAPAAKAAGVGGGMFGAAGYLGANAASLLFLAGGLGFGVLYSHLLDWGVMAATALGFVTMAVILLILAGILALVGKKKLKDVQPPKQAIAEAKTTVETVKRSLTNGVNQVEADIRDRKGLSSARRAAKEDAASSTGSRTESVREKASHLANAAAAKVSQVKDGSTKPGSDATGDSFGGATRADIAAKN